jgi:cell division protein FtsX
VERRLRSEACVRKTVFISKTAALAMFKEKHPKLYAALPPGLGNPLPDSVEAMTDRPSCAVAIAAAARAAHWPGVHHIGLERRPTTQAGS